MTTTETKRERLTKAIKRLESTEVMIATNQGTYGAVEACRAIGCGSPEFADCDVYETPLGVRRVRGCDMANAPGRMRWFNRELTAKKAELQRLVAELKAV